MARAAHAEERLETALRDSGMRGRYLADAVLGATDGIVTTFAVVAGATGAKLSPSVVLIVGCANLLADGFSMAVSNYLGARSQGEYWEEERRRETWEIEHVPEAEREEVRRLYGRKGFEGDTLEKIVATLTSDKERWVDEMMREELGIQEDKMAPFASGLVTFGAFVLAGFLPLFSYVLAFIRPALMPSAFPVSVAVTGIAFFFVGAARRFITHRPWWRSGLEILGFGGLAAAIAFGVGHVLRLWIG